MTIYKSPFEDVPITDLTITQRVFAGLDRDRAVMIEGPTGREITGAELEAAIKSFAGGLLERGLTAAHSVAIIAPNIPEYAVALHGVWWAGGTVTTINPTYTAAEVRHQLIDANADRVITIAPLVDLVREAMDGTPTTEIIVIGDAPEGTTAFADLMGPPLAEQIPVDLDNHVAALPYSSGTTGLPKGVMLTHRGLVVNTDQMLSNVQMFPQETTIGFLPFFHIYGLHVIINLYLAAGGAVVTMPRFDLQMYLQLCTQHQTPRLWVVPPVMLAFAGHPMVDEYDLSFVQQINSAAAPLGGDVALAVAQRLGTDVTQGYGMTELSPASHLTLLGQGKAGASGVTMPNTECRIIDPDTLTDMPKGEDGELWIRGPQVMKGYLNRPDATAGTITPEGWLRTGDIGHFDADGHLFITDRLKELIKFKGFQVAPAEVEAQLLTHPAISDAAVIGVPDEDAGELPMAFVVAAPGHAAPDIASIQGHLETRLASFKQVRVLEIVDEIPKSPSGKILRRFLRDRVEGR